MNYWLVKSEPEVYPWNQFVEDKTTSWTGVRNYAARLHLNGMQNKDKVLFYHSNTGLEVVGIATVVKTAYPDPTTDDDRWVTVDLKAEKTLKSPVSLAAIKKQPELKNIALVRIGRLSVMPLTPQEFETILKMGS